MLQRKLRAMKNHKMNVLKSVKVFLSLFTAMTTLIGCTNVSSEKKVRVFDFKYEVFDFLNGAVVFDLPDKPKARSVDGYDKILVDKYISFTIGHAEISVVSVNMFLGSVREEVKNKIVIRTIKAADVENIDIARIAIWYGVNPMILQVTTNALAGTFPTQADLDDRIRKDDEIFEHIVQSFQYRKEDGTYAKPEVVRQADEVTEEKFKGVEFHGNK